MRRRPSSPRGRRWRTAAALLAAAALVLWILLFYGCSSRNGIWLSHGDLIFLPSTENSIPVLQAGPPASAVYTAPPGREKGAAVQAKACTAAPERIILQGSTTGTGRP